MSGKNKKANGALLILVVIAVIAIIYIIASNAVKECWKDTDCGQERYCGSDFKCHDMKIVNKTIINNDYGLWKAAFIIGFAIIIAAFILRWKKNSA